MHRPVLQDSTGEGRRVHNVLQDITVMEQVEEGPHVQKNSIVDQEQQNRLTHLILLGHVPLDICVMQAPQTLEQEALLHVLKTTSVQVETQAQADLILQQPAQQLAQTL